MSDDLYREYILEHYRNPQNYGTLEAPTFEAEGQNPLCGDELHVQVQVDDDDRITAVKFTGQGCAISQAAMSILSDELIGKTFAEVEQMNRDDIVELLGIELTPVRLKCALLGLVVVKMGMHDHAGTAAPAGWEGADEISWGRE
ncbi:MAG: SUF system NifU family Fe-S cluster assembly protein [Thermoleophilia bacterium]|nr:SUF system NifU family Fe-S cluster assembly protein [Thermoleophilia bacterium]